MFADLKGKYNFSSSKRQKSKYQVCHLENVTDSLLEVLAKIPKSQKSFI